MSKLSVWTLKDVTDFHVYDGFIWIEQDYIHSEYMEYRHDMQMSYNPDTKVLTLGYRV